MKVQVISFRRSEPRKIVGKLSQIQDAQGTAFVADENPDVLIAQGIKIPHSKWKLLKNDEEMIKEAQAGKDIFYRTSTFCGPVQRFAEA